MKLTTRNNKVFHVQSAICNSHDTGFTLIELLIAVFISVFALAAVYTSFTLQQRSFMAQDQVAETNLTSKIAFNIIAKDIRNAGFGYPTDENPVVNSYSGSVTVTNGASSSDSMNLIGGFRQLATLTSSPNVGTNTISISYGTGATKFNTSNRSYISLDGLSFSTINSCTTDAGGNCLDTSAMTLDDSVALPIPLGRPVYLVEDITYQMSGNNLQRVRAGGGSGNVDTIASNIDDLQVVWEDVNGDTEINLGDRIRINLLARTSGEDTHLSPSQKPYHPSLTIEDNTTSVNDSFRRRLWTMEVALRN
jgi:prepilin-type N-terminal cleavage/methylation domain-containing protein